jgi:hypothetical protein
MRNPAGGELRDSAAAVSAGLVSLVGIFVLSNDAEYLFDRLVSRALPLVIVSAGSGLAALALVHRETGRGARIASGSGRHVARRRRQKAPILGGPTG